MRVHRRPTLFLLVAGTLAALVAIGCGIQPPGPPLPGGTSGIPTLDELILRPKAEITQTPATFGYEYEEVALPVAEGRSIVVWHVPAPASRATVLVLPGSDANKGSYAAALPLLIPHGYSCVLMDYEGFGSSPGEARLAHTVDDAYAAADYALSFGQKTVIIAASLGTPLAVRVAADLDLAGLILEGTLVLKEQGSLYIAANGGVPLFGFFSDAWIRGQTPDAYDILKYIPQVAEPKLFMHSPADEVTPYAGARKVFDVAPERKEFWDMQGGHGDMIHLDPQAYEQHVVAFIESVL